MPFKRPLVAALVIAMLTACFSGAAVAASATSTFNVTYKQFHSLKKNSRRAKYRSNWKKVERGFEKSYRADTNGPFAPKSLYYLGRTNEELGRWSGLKSDYRVAVRYFSQAVQEFPSHSWTDDCLYRRAMIRYTKLNERTNARRDLAYLIDNYSSSDMAPKAKRQLRKWGGRVAAKRAPKPKPAPVAAKPNPQRSGAVHATPTKGAYLSMVRYKSSDDYTRVVLEMQGKVPFRYKLLDPAPKHGRPHRLYLDLMGATLGSDVDRKTNVADGILKQIRAGQHSKSTARVVLDFLSLQDYKVFPLDNPFRIVIDVYSPKGGKASPGVKQTVDNSEYRPPKESKKMAGDLLEQLGLTVNTIMLDAGHGGKDPGAVANGLREKNVNLRFVKILAKELKKSGFNVIYTRDKDVFIPLEQRTAMANVQKADLFLSVHCNAHRNRRINGLETYSLNLAKTQDAVRVAARENAVDPRSISDLQFILTDLMINSKMKESKDLAGDVQRQTLRSVRRTWKVGDKGVREAPFYVLMGAKMPSVLVELGYLTNSVEAERLKSDAYLKRLAQGIVTGIVAYKEKIERFALK